MGAHRYTVMALRPCQSFTLVGALMLAWAHVAGADEADFIAMEGKWMVVSFTMAGRPIDNLLHDNVVFADGRAVYRGKQRADQATYRLDSTARPKHFDLLLTGADDKPALCQGIYSLEEDRLTVCHGEPGNPRPTEFTSTERDGHMLVVLERVAVASQE